MRCPIEDFRAPWSLQHFIEMDLVRLSHIGFEQGGDGVVERGVSHHHAGFEVESKAPIVDVGASHEG